ncbi:calphotin-like [Macrobrachium rosenbergii]|uniref:calphotin-like n=1 Tax=Macrobrachium rosenbergii TaxID=79674 RepID=UPI0034D62696
MQTYESDKPVRKAVNPHYGGRSSPGNGSASSLALLGAVWHSISTQPSDPFDKVPGGAHAAPTATTTTVTMTALAKMQTTVSTHFPRQVTSAVVDQTTMHAPAPQHAVPLPPGFPVAPSAHAVPPMMVTLTVPHVMVPAAPAAPVISADWAAVAALPAPAVPVAPVAAPAVADAPASWAAPATPVALAAPAAPVIAAAPLWMGDLTTTLKKVTKRRSKKRSHKVSSSLSSLASSLSSSSAASSPSPQRLVG